HDRVVRRALHVERGAQPLDGGIEPRAQLADDRDVHRRREDVVRGLAEIHVVVRMHWTLAATRPARELYGAVRDHLVHVHVGRRPGAGLEDDERELAVEAAGDVVVRGPDDQPRDVHGQRAELRVHDRGGALHEPERADQRRTPHEAFTPDRKMLAGTLRLRAPISCGLDPDLPERVPLDPRVVRQMVSRVISHGAPLSHDGAVSSRAARLPRLDGRIRRASVEDRPRREACMISVGQPEPAWAAVAYIDGEERPIRSEDYRGRWHVLYWYPLDFTFVC